jgi:ornithine cyclodeaminase/alanine dehydrogenase-like protein (mu-crystallin family)
MLLLDNEDIRKAFSIDACLRVLEDAYREQARGAAVTRLRTQTYVPLPEPDLVYCLKTMEGALPKTGYMALRLTSDVVSEAVVDGIPRREKLPRGPGETYCGLILLFSLRELKPVAILHDGYIQVYRVACTSALGTRLLARENAGDVALLGSAGQAWAHLEALAAVQTLKRVRVYSPTPEHRETFAARARGELGLPVEAAASACDAIAGADIVIAATNTSAPIVEGKWLSAGAHVVSIVSGDQRMRRRELDDEVLRRAATVIVHSKAHAIEQEQGDLAGPVAAGILSWEGMYDLSELVAGEAPGRSRPDEITVFKNNVGLGLQFAAVASSIYEQAKRLELGRALPDEWFLQKMKP